MNIALTYYIEIHYHTIIHIQCVISICSLIIIHQFYNIDSYLFYFNIHLLLYILHILLCFSILILFVQRLIENKKNKNNNHPFYVISFSNRIESNYTIRMQSPTDLNTTAETTEGVSIGISTSLSSPNSSIGTSVVGDANILTPSHSPSFDPDVAPRKRRRKRNDPQPMQSLQSESPVTPDVETFQGQILLNPDGSGAFIIDHLSATVVPSMITSTTTSANLAESLVSSISTPSLLLPNRKDSFSSDRDNPRIHSFRVVTSPDDLVTTSIATSNVRSSTEQKIQTKPILMCFLCKLSFGNQRTFLHHAENEHKLNVTDSVITQTDNLELSSAIIQRNCDEKPLISYLEPIELKQSQTSLKLLQQQQTLSKDENFGAKIIKNVDLNKKLSLKKDKNAVDEFHLKKEDAVHTQSKQSNIDETNTTYERNYIDQDFDQKRCTLNSSIDDVDEDENACHIVENDTLENKITLPNNLEILNELLLHQQHQQEHQATVESTLTSQVTQQQFYCLQHQHLTLLHKSPQFDCKKCEQLTAGLTANCQEEKSDNSPPRSPSSNYLINQHFFHQKQQILVAVAAAVANSQQQFHNNSASTTPTKSPSLSSITAITPPPGISSTPQPMLQQLQSPANTPQPTFTIGACPDHINGRPVGVECSR